METSIISTTSVTETPKIPLEEAIEMSLDDYINKAGILNPNLRPKKDLRSLLDLSMENPRETEDDDVDMFEDMPHDHSAQWRVYPPNNSALREPGMPPLIPIKASSTPQSVNRRNRGNNNNTKRWKFDDNKFTKECEYEQQKRDRFGGNGGVRKRRPNGRQWNRNNGYNHRFNNNRDYNYKYNNNNNQRNNQRGNQNNYQRSKSPTFEVHVPPVASSTNPPFMNQPTVTNGINLMSMPFNAGPSIMPVGQNLTSCADLFQPNNNNNNTMQALGNMMASKMPNLPMVPFVGKIFETIEAVQNNFLKKYDMHLQKQISQIQGREMMYKCGGVESVVSFDGPGIECETKLHTTDLTMNQRFA